MRARKLSYLKKYVLLNIAAALLDLQNPNTVCSSFAGQPQYTFVPFILTHENSIHAQYCLALQAEI